MRRTIFILMLIASGCSEDATNDPREWDLGRVGEADANPMMRDASLHLCDREGRLITQDCSASGLECLETNEFDWPVLCGIPGASCTERTRCEGDASSILIARWVVLA